MKEAVPHNPAADTFDLKAALFHIWEVCCIYWWVLVVTPILTLAVVVAYIIVWPPVYVAEVTVLGENPQDVTRNDFYKDWNLFRKEDLKSEAAMIASTSVAKDVVINLSLTYDDVYHAPLNHLAYLWTESWVGKRYRAAKKWVFPPKESGFAPTQEQIDLARTVDDFKAGIDIGNVPNSAVGLIGVRGPSPRVAQYANELVVTYLKHRQKRYIKEAQRAFFSLKKEHDKAKHELTQHEQGMKDFATEHEILMDFEKSKLEVTDYVQKQALVADLQSQLAVLEMKREAVKGLMENEPEKVVSTETYRKNPLLETMESQLYQLHLQLTQAKFRYRENSPEISEINKQIESLSNDIDKTQKELNYSRAVSKNATRENLNLQLVNLETEVAGVKAHLSTKSEQLQKTGAKVRNIPEIKATWTNMLRENSLMQKKYTELQQRMSMAEVSLATINSAPAALKIIEYAQAPSKPRSPKKKLLLGGGVGLGVFGGVLIAMLIDLLSGRVTRARLRMHAKEFPMFATLDKGSQSFVDLRQRQLEASELDSDFHIAPPERGHY